MSNALKTLLLTRHMPSPTRGGSSMRNHVVLRGLRRLGPAGVACIRLGTPRLPAPDGLAALAEGTVPLSLPRMAAAWLRSPLDAAGAFARFAHDPATERTLDAALSSLRPDVAVCVEPWFVAYVPSLRRHGCRIVLDLHNIEASLYGRLARDSRHPRDKIFAALLHRIGAGCERRFISLADQVWTCSAGDAAAVRALYGGPDVRVVESGLDTDYHSGSAVPAAVPEAAGKPVLLYCANFGYAPNAEAADALMETVLPSVRRRVPQCVLVLAGANPTRRMLRVAGPDVVVTGAVDDIRPYWALPGAVAAMPLLHGSGTRLKALEAFAWNVPVVSTRKGMEGIGAVDGMHALLADDAAGVAEGAVRMFAEPGLRAALTGKAAALLRERYSCDAAASAVAGAIADVRHAS